PREFSRIGLENRGEHAIIMLMTNRRDSHPDSVPLPHASPPPSGDAIPTSDPIQQRIADLLAALDRAAQDYDTLKQENELLRQELERYLRYVYGRRSERHDDPGQGHLFTFSDDIEEEAPQAKPETPPAAAPRKPRESRKLDFSRLPHVRIEHDLPEAEKTCACCGKPKARIGEDERRELEYIPARLEVRVHVLPKYACSQCRDGVASPDGPDRPLAGCIAGAGLLSQILTSKFIDHLPLYRLEDISVRYGLRLPRATLCDWVRNAAGLLVLLYELQKKLVLQSSVIWTDDTSVRVLIDEPPGSRTARFWLYHGDRDHPYDVYDFTTSRERDGPKDFLVGFTGYLQADAYSGYDGIYIGSQTTIVEVACWAHARRKFYDARSSAPGHAELILGGIRR